MGTGPVHVSYLRIVGEAGATVRKVLAGSVGSVVWEIATTSIGHGGSRGPWLGEEGGTRVLDEELWPPQVFSIAGMDEDSRDDEGFRREGRVWV